MAVAVATIPDECATEVVIGAVPSDQVHLQLTAGIDVEPHRVADLA
jgi:hypothetical protein